MKNYYQIFGLNITSEIPLPANPVRQQQPDNAADITIEYGDTPVVLLNPQIKGFGFQVAPGEFLLRVNSIARYHVQNGSRITITPDYGARDDDISLFLMGSVIGALLHQRNILPLHAGAIQVNGKSVIFAGPSGVGKSTLTAAFHRRGYQFLADDVCAVMLLNGTPRVLPGFAHMKLWSDTLEKLKMSGKRLKRIRCSEKFFLSVGRMQQTSVPLHHVFILETDNTDRLEVAALKGRKKIDPIIDNTYRLGLLEGLGGKAGHFRQCAAVAAETAIYRAVRPNRGFLLNDLMDMVEAKFLP